MVARCHARGSYLSARGSVTIGLCASEKGAGAYGLGWKESDSHAVQRNDVRYLCGVFLRPRGETALLFSTLGACQDGLFFQPFWTEEAHESGTAEEIAAVAARFHMVEANVELF